METTLSKEVLFDSCIFRLLLSSFFFSLSFVFETFLANTLQQGHSEHPLVWMKNPCININIVVVVVC